MKSLIFQKTHARATEANFFLDTTIRCTKETSSGKSESDLKNESLEYERSEKLTFENSVWVKKYEVNFFFKKCVFMPLEVNFVLGTKEKMCKEILFKIINVEI